ncbi:MAG: hypothetical protein ACU0FT_04165 [Paracoccus sp. (in: a-proteobacteria)]|uniref:hypothetical protein n=1 Tax=Paracoccus sp. TaxID=267 RepID=UPI0040598D80
MLRDYEDLIFQAHCQISHLQDHFDDGGTLQSCAENVVVMHLRDGSETTINLAPVVRLIEGLRRLPKTSTERT